MQRLTTLASAACFFGLILTTGCDDPLLQDDVAGFEDEYLEGEDLEDEDFETGGSETEGYADFDPDLTLDAEVDPSEYDIPFNPGFVPICTNVCDCFANPPWLCGSLLPDFEVTQIATAGCTGPGGLPIVAVTVHNAGLVSGASRVDTFANIGAVPDVGAESDDPRMTGAIAAGASQTLTFVVNPFSHDWIDVIVDTTEVVDELDETNNIASEELDFPDCSFS